MVTKIERLNLIVVQEIKDAGGYFYLLRQKRESDVYKAPPKNLFLFGNFIVNQITY